MQSAEQIWREQRSALFSYIRRRVGDGDLAEDLLQEVFVRIHTRLATLNNSESLQSWIYQIVRNVIIDHHRTRKPFETLSADFDLSIAEPARDELFQQGAASWLPPMLECLPESYREAVRLSDLQELPLAEVARLQGLSLSGAKSRVQRGRAKLKAVLLESCEFEFDSRGRPIDCLPKPECCCR